MARVCNNCGRGYEHDEGESFICEVCGAINNADGSWEYDCSRDAISEMESRINEYDGGE